MSRAHDVTDRGPADFDAIIVGSGTDEKTAAA